MNERSDIMTIDEFREELKEEIMSDHSKKEIKRTDTIKVGTLNVQNRTKDINSAKALATHIENTGYYFLGTQELTRVFSNELINNLKKYKLYGKRRYGNSNLLKHVKFIDDINESNAIITKETVVNVETDFLPWIAHNPKDLFESVNSGSIVPRIMTIIDIEDEDYGKIYAVNTHLDYQVKNIQINQMKNIYRILKTLRKRYPIVLTGDFNIGIKDEHFNSFIKDLDTLGLKRVPINDRLNETAINHIFIPKNWIIERSGLIDDSNLSTLTDNKGIYADIRIK